ASGDYALALSGSQAAGDYSLAWSGATNGEGSVAFMNGVANGNYSMTFGVNAETASGATNAIAMGANTEALGSHSIAIGHDITAYSFSETVFGFNEEVYTPVSTTAINANDRLFVVGNGNAAVGIPTDNNAFTILKNGRTGIMRIPTTNILEVNGNASKTTAGDWLANSDRRLKKNIKTFNEEQALQKLLQMRGVTYEWNDNQTGNNRPEGQQYGFVAQELQQVFPENVSLDNQGFYQTAYGTYDALYVQSIKALNSKIEDLEQENKTLKAKLDELYSMVKQMAEER
ncbi:MAG: tail fiber domain-containing protein, partial [Winogradskyella sp.]|nr:tail fiber domain-containing protein [Winogradskyella sp.]